MKVIVIGSGISGLATAGLLAKAGVEVELFEAREQFGGRAGRLQVDGFTFDTGPSWYLMPEVFEHFFQLMGTTAASHLTLKKLTPSYRIWFESLDQPIDFSADREAAIDVFERLEPGAGAKLAAYLEKSARLYRLATTEFLYRNYAGPHDLLNPRVLRQAVGLPVLSRMDRYVRRSFRRPELRQVLEYPLVFLGASPYQAPAIYSLMSHLDFNQGVYYPQGGIYTIVEALASLAQTAGARLHLRSPVQRIMTRNGRAVGVSLADGSHIAADAVVSAAGLAHTELDLLQSAAQTYPQRFWRRRTMAPSALLLYLGLRDRVPTVAHHNLYFCRDWQRNFDQLYSRPALPTNPSLYLSAPSVSDASVVPAGRENLFVLVPLPAHQKVDNEERYAQQMIEHIGQRLAIPGLAERVVVQRRFGPADFSKQYQSYGGSALGLAHTFRQSAWWRPGNRSRKIAGLYYAGADTNPGIGMPTSLISAELVYKRLVNDRSAGPVVNLKRLG